MWLAHHPGLRRPEGSSLGLLGLGAARGGWISSHYQGAKSWARVMSREGAFWSGHAHSGSRWISGATVAVRHSAQSPLGTYIPPGTHRQDWVFLGPWLHTIWMTPFYQYPEGCPQGFPAHASKARGFLPTQSFQRLVLSAASPPSSPDFHNSHSLSGHVPQTGVHVCFKITVIISLHVSSYLLSRPKNKLLYIMDQRWGLHQNCRASHQSAVYIDRALTMPKQYSRASRVLAHFLSSRQELLSSQFCSQETESQKDGTAGWWSQSVLLTTGLGWDMSLRASPGLGRITSLSESKESWGCSYTQAVRPWTDHSTSPRPFCHPCNGDKTCPAHPAVTITVRRNNWCENTQFLADVYMKGRDEWISLMLFLASGNIEDLTEEERQTRQAFLPRISANTQAKCVRHSSECCQERRVACNSPQSLRFTRLTPKWGRLRGGPCFFSCFMTLTLFLD